MKKIKIDYKKHIAKDGTIYDQTITLSKDFVNYINKNIKYYKNASPEVKNCIAEDIGFSIYYDYYLEEIKEEINFLKMTQLQFIYYYLSINNYDIKRIKTRNTIIKVVK